MLALTFTNANDGLRGDITLADLLGSPDEQMTEEQQVREAVTLALMLDARAAPPLIEANENPRGFFAAEVGSLIWAVRRQPITEALLRTIENMAREAIEKIPLNDFTVAASRSRNNRNAVILDVIAKAQRITIAL